MVRVHEGALFHLEMQIKAPLSNERVFLCAAWRSLVVDVGEGRNRNDSPLVFHVLVASHLMQPIPLASTIEMAAVISLRTF
jgi:hypothetical protein